MARGIAFALAENGLGKVVKRYFDVNPSLPPKGLNIKTFDIFEGDSLSFRDLLKEVLKTKATNELLLVVHGYLNGVGIVLPLVPGALDTKGRHLELLMQIDASGKDPDDKQLGQLGIKKDDCLQLIDLMKKVQAMSLTTVEWRACDLGKNPTTLEQFRKFFGATRMGAPTMENIFGNSPVLYGPMDRLPEQKGFAAYSYPDKFNPTVVNFIQLDGGSGWPQAGRTLAANEAELNAWIRKYINPSGKVVDKSVQIHALWKDPDADHALDNPTPILPLEANYATNIRYAP